MTYDTQGRRVLHGHPQSWDDVMGVKHVSHPSTWEAEAKALRAENAKLEGEKAVLQVGCNKAMQRVQELEQTVDGIWRYAVDTTVSDHHFRGWAEVEARAALQKQEGKINA